MSNDHKALGIHLRLLSEQAAQATSTSELAEIYAQMRAHLEPEAIAKILERDVRRVLDGRPA